MSFYDDEILYELIVGKEYTESDLRTFLQENNRVSILSKSMQNFTYSNDRKLKVLDKLEGYIHQHDREKFTYQSSNVKNIIYILE